jgi:phage terminase large subunit
VIDEYRDNGIFFVPAKNEVVGGINRVNEYFKSDRLKIFKNCVNLVEEVENYRWQKIKAGQMKNAPEAPVKFKDHACDALRYMIASRPESPTEIKKVDYETHAKEVFDPFISTETEPEQQHDFAGGIAN